MCSYNKVQSEFEAENNHCKLYKSHNFDIDNGVRSNDKNYFVTDQKPFMTPRNKVVPKLVFPIPLIKNEPMPQTSILQEDTSQLQKPEKLFLKKGYQNKHQHQLPGSITSFSTTPTNHQ